MDILLPRAACLGDVEMGTCMSRRATLSARLNRVGFGLLCPENLDGPRAKSGYGNKPFLGRLRRAAPSEMSRLLKLSKQVHHCASQCETSIVVG